MNSGSSSQQNEDNNENRQQQQRQYENIGEEQLFQESNSNTHHSEEEKEDSPTDLLFFEEQEEKQKTGKKKKKPKQKKSKKSRILSVVDEQSLLPTVEEDDTSDSTDYYSSDEFNNNNKRNKRSKQTEDISNNDNDKNETRQEEHEDTDGSTLYVNSEMAENAREEERREVRFMDDIQDDSSTPALMDEPELHAVRNLDTFFRTFYEFFYSRGFYSILLSRFLHVFTLMFIIIFSTYLIIFADWNTIWNCKLQECGQVRQFRPNALQNLNLARWMGIIFECGILIYLLVEIIRSFIDIRDFWAMKQFVAHYLNVDENDIQTIQWGELVDKVVNMQHRRRISVTKHLNAHDIANRIMRKDNYLIAFINKNVLNLTIPVIGKTLLTKTVEWNLRYIVSSMFDEKFRIRYDIRNNPQKLKSKFRKLGFLNLIAAPFIFVFLLFYFFFRYTAEYQQTPSALGLKKWNPLALWKFREFNEYPHTFEKRINQSYEHATNYLNQFPSIWVSSLASTVMFISGAFAAVIIALSFFKYPVLLYTEFADHNLLWWLGMFTVVVATAKQHIISDTAVFDPNTMMEKVAAHTHYYPSRWKEVAHHPKVLNEFKGLYQLHIKLFLQELCSVLTTPLVLLFSLPSCSERLVDFINETTVDVPGVGHVCSFATFDFSKHGNPKYGTALDEDEPHPRIKSKHGKMEKSFLSFMAAHPTWVPPKENGSNKMMEKLDNVSQSMNLSASQPGVGQSSLSGDGSFFSSTAGSELSVSLSDSLKQRRKSVQDINNSNEKEHRPIDDTSVMQESLYWALEQVKKEHDNNNDNV